MTWIDWLIVTLVVVSMPQGLRRGAATAAGSAVGVVLAYAVASYTYRGVAASFGFIPLPPPWQATIAFVFVLLVAATILTIFAGVLFGTITPSRSSRLAGAVAGALRGILLSAALLVVALASPAGDPVASDVVRSAIAAPITDGATATIEWINSVMPPAFQIFGSGGARF